MLLKIRDHSAQNIKCWIKTRKNTVEKNILYLVIYNSHNNVTPLLFKHQHILTHLPSHTRTHLLLTVRNTLISLIHTLRAILVRFLVRLRHKISQAPCLQQGTSAWQQRSQHTAAYLNHLMTHVWSCEHVSAYPGFINALLQDTIIIRVDTQGASMCVEICM